MNQALKKIVIKTKKQTFSEVIGNNSSKQKGEGYDFCELKEYEYGDEVKHIDWITTAKMQKPYVKVFNRQKELNIKIVSFLNGSVFFGTKRFKQEVITEIATALGFICVKQNDPFTSFIANEKLELCTKKSKKSFNVNQMAQKIFEYDVLGKQIDYPLVIKDLFKAIHHKSIIFLIGDFFNIEDLDLKLLGRKHEVILIIVRDKFEEQLDELGNINFKDPSLGITYEGLLNKSTKEEYKAKIKNNDHKLYTHLQDCGIKFTKIYTSEEAIKKLIGLLR